MVTRSPEVFEDLRQVGSSGAGDDIMGIAEHALQPSSIRVCRLLSVGLSRPKLKVENKWEISAAIGFRRGSILRNPACATPTSWWTLA